VLARTRASDPQKGFFDYNCQHNMSIRIAGILDSYEPRKTTGDGRIVINAVVQALPGEEITIYGEGQQTRSFCFVSDLINGFVRIMYKTESLIGPTNLGNLNEFTLLELT
jgi:UDP-glucuronate decarboxylase